MVKKTVGYVELEWTCPNCQTRNPGPNKFCNGCGAPQPQDVAFEQPAQEKLLTDAAKVQQAKAGPDVHCPFCNARSPAGAEFCGACGASLSQATAREHGKVLGAHRDTPAAEIACPSCGAPNPADAGRCQKCGAPLPGAEKVKASPAPARPLNRKFLLLGAGLIGLCLAALCIFGLLSTRTQEKTASVQQVAWERSVAIEALGPVEREDWADALPSDAEDVSCREARRGTSDSPEPGAIEVCGTPYTLDSGSGFGEVVQDCVYEVYDDLCSYTVLDWAPIDQVTASGSDLAPYWPQPSLASDQRLGAQEEVYRVVLVTEDGRYVYEPSGEAEFSRFIPGSTWVLDVNTFGALVGVEPVR